MAEQVTENRDRAKKRNLAHSFGFGHSLKTTYYDCLSLSESNLGLDTSFVGHRQARYRGECPGSHSEGWATIDARLSVHADRRPG